MVKQTPDNRRLHDLRLIAVGTTVSGIETIGVLQVEGSVMKRLLPAFLLSTICPMGMALAGWDPPTNPDPEAILDEAREDARAGRYEDALAKHLWFHHHAEEYEPAIGGVRCSFALYDWHVLGRVYPPALKALKDTRDQAVKQVLAGDGDVRSAFIDVEAINEELDEQESTVAVFLQLDKEAPEKAQEVYDVAQRALIKARRFDLCGKYTDSYSEYAVLFVELVTGRGFAHEKTTEAARDEALRMAEVSFLEKAAKLIAILALNDRKVEAKNLAESVRHLSQHKSRDMAISEALAGKIATLEFDETDLSNRVPLLRFEKPANGK